jgi:hypothetical protein
MPCSPVTMAQLPFAARRRVIATPQAAQAVLQLPRVYFRQMPPTLAAKTRHYAAGEMMRKRDGTAPVGCARWVCPWSIPYGPPARAGRHGRTGRGSYHPPNQPRFACRLSYRELCLDRCGAIHSNPSRWRLGGTRVGLSPRAGSRYLDLDCNRARGVLLRGPAHFLPRPPFFPRRLPSLPCHCLWSGAGKSHCQPPASLLFSRPFSCRCTKADALRASSAVQAAS